MMVIRPILTNDLDQLEQLANQSTSSLTTLPKDRKKLDEKIQRAMEAFNKSLEAPDNEAYLFVLEDTTLQKVVGTCGIFSRVGTTEPFYTYKVATQVHTSEEFNMYKKLEVLQLVNDYTGASEIGTLFLAPDYRKGGNGRLLSRSRFLFMADLPHRFSDRVIAEMRGVQDEQGHSSFWHALGKVFFDMDFSFADNLSGIGKKQFITDLVPRHPIYVQLLPKEAQDAIGVVHPETIPALKMLEREGFHYRNYVDIFDAGPTVESFVSQVHTVRESIQAPIAQVLDSIESESFLMSNTRLNFRAGMGNLAQNPDQSINITSELAQALEVETGDSIRFIPFQMPR